MAIEIINVGAAPNDQQGDPLRTAFIKINNNFALFQQTGFFTSEAYTAGLLPQVIFETPVATFTQAQLQINSSDPASANAQNITITAAINNDSTGVKWSGHSTLFESNPVVNYDMDVDSGNVRLLVLPLYDSAEIYHFISAQITYSSIAPGIPMELDGNPGNVLGTEINTVITTEQPA